MYRRIATVLTIVATTVSVLGCGGVATDPLAIPDSPDGTVRAVRDGLVGHHPEIVWRALPPSYQADVIGLAASFAENMDPVIFDRTVAVARKGVVVLQSKKDLILDTETVRNSGVDIEEVDAMWEGFVHVFDTVLASDLARLEAYSEFDVEAVLATTGADLMAHAAGLPVGEEEMEKVSRRLTDMENATIELVSENGDEAVVRISVPDKEPKDVPMTRVEERWLPTELVQAWPGAMEQANERIEFLGSEDATQVKIQILFGIGMAEGFIDQIELMEVPEDLDNLIGGILGNLVQRTGAQEG